MPTDVSTPSAYPRVMKERLLHGPQGRGKAYPIPAQLMSEQGHSGIGPDVSRKAVVQG